MIIPLILKCLIQAVGLNGFPVAEITGKDVDE